MLRSFCSLLFAKLCYRFILMIRSLLRPGTPHLRHLRSLVLLEVQLRCPLSGAIMWVLVFRSGILPHYRAGDFYIFGFLKSNFPRSDWWLALDKLKDGQHYSVGGSILSLGTVTTSTLLKIRGSKRGFIVHRSESCIPLMSSCSWF